MIEFYNIKARKAIMVKDFSKVSTQGKLIVVQLKRAKYRVDPFLEMNEIFNCAYLQF